MCPRLKAAVIYGLRAYAIALYLSLLVNIALAAATQFTLSPLKRVEPMLVTFSLKSEQVVKIEPFERGTKGLRVMTEKLVEEYVKIREKCSPTIRKWASGIRLAFTQSHRATAI